MTWLPVPAAPGLSPFQSGNEPEGRAPGWAAAVADAPGRAVLGDEAGQLRSGPLAHLAHGAAHHPLVGLAQLPVPEQAKRLGHKLVARAALQGSDLDRLGAVEERADLVQGPYSVGLKHHDHLPMMPRSGPLQAHLTLESPVPLQAHVSLEKAAGRRILVRPLPSASIRYRLGVWDMDVGNDLKNKIKQRIIWLSWDESAPRTRCFRGCFGRGRREARDRQFGLGACAAEIDVTIEGQEPRERGG